MTRLCFQVERLRSITLKNVAMYVHFSCKFNISLASYTSYSAFRINFQEDAYACACVCIAIPVMDIRSQAV